MRFRYPLLLLVVVLFSACTKDESPAPTFEVPANYDSANFRSDVATANSLRIQLNTLVNEAKRGRIVTNTVLASTLEQLYTASSPSLRDATRVYYNGLLSGTNGFFAELAAASGNSYSPGVPVGNGGVYGGYLFDENGLEMEQLIEKGLFGSLNYYQAHLLLQGTVSQAVLNQVLALYGAHPDFANTPTAANATNPDVFMANYAARRSDVNDANSLYNQMKKAFITAQAAIKAGQSRLAERNAALADIRLLWEKINAATVINYCHSVISTMSQTAPTDAQKAAALHAYGECVGFLHGWRQLPADSKRISDAQIDELLTLLLAAPGTTPESYKFITEPGTQLPKLQDVIGRLQTIYGFTNAEVESFRNNWVSLQNR
jgi:hypothetical protein